MNKQWKALTEEERAVLLEKGTEAPFSGVYNDHFVDGIYVCKQCEAPLFTSVMKFKSQCGWPSFDEAIDGAVMRAVDADGVRVEILCARCEGHLGHVFDGENYTATQTRHCVNSVSMNFLSFEALLNAAESEDARFGLAYLAAGCFWGVEKRLMMLPGVLATRVGYMGGDTSDPTYEQVCRHTTGHAETVQVIFDNARLSFEKLLRYFFTMHDASQKDRQGVDVGSQYRSAIFVLEAGQEKIAGDVIEDLRQNGETIVTEVTRGKRFWPAEESHQKYHFRR